MHIIASPLRRVCLLLGWEQVDYEKEDNEKYYRVKIFRYHCDSHDYTLLKVSADDLHSDSCTGLGLE
jgi:hypothetical protein